MGETHEHFRPRNRAAASAATHQPSARLSPQPVVDLDAAGAHPVPHARPRPVGVDRPQPGRPAAGRVARQARASRPGRGLRRKVRRRAAPLRRLPRPRRLVRHGFSRQTARLRLLLRRVRLARGSSALLGGVGRVGGRPHQSGVRLGCALGRRGFVVSGRLLSPARRRRRSPGGGLHAQRPSNAALGTCHKGRARGPRGGHPVRPRG